MRRSLLVVFLLLACSVVALADETLYGFYEPVCRSMYPDLARLCYRDMVRHGCRTAAPSGNACHAFGPAEMPWIGLARQVDMMVEEGLVQPGVPILTLSCDPKWFAQAKAIAAHPDQWPELVCGNVDEPSYTKMQDVRQISCRAREVGVRNGTAIAGYSLFQRGPTAFSDGVLADWLDMWIVLASTWREDLYAKAFEQDAYLAAYWAFERDPDRDRYLTGLWCARWNPKTFLFWAYKHSILAELPNGQPLVAEGLPVDNLSFVVETVGGPKTTEAYEQMAEGIRDHALLDRLAEKGGNEAWLHQLLETVPCAMPCPPKPVPAHPDWKTLRRQLERRLAER